MTKYSFQTSAGEVLLHNDPRLIEVCERVATWYEKQADLVRAQNSFAKHVTESQKGDYINKHYLQWAEKIRQRENLNNFSVWQRVNAELTGECVAFLP
jgi:hypothetical protein